MAVKLRVLAGPPDDPSSPRAERTVILDDNLTEIRLGRRAGLEIELPFATVSPIHARLVRDGAGWLVEDLGSAQGSWLDGALLPPGRARAIPPGSTLRLADISLVFDGVGVGAGASSSEGTATIARRLVSDLFRSRSGGQAPRLVGRAGAPGDQGLPLTLQLAVPDRSYLVGRGESCDLVVPSEEISREHAVLVRRWEGVHVRDLGSKNGVRVGGQPIVGEHRLHDGDQLEIGALLFSLDDPEERYLKQIESAPEAPPAQGPAPLPATGGPTVVDQGPNQPARRRRVNVPFIVATVVLIAVAVVASLLIFAF